MKRNTYFRNGGSAQPHTQPDYAMMRLLRGRGWFIFLMRIVYYKRKHYVLDIKINNDLIYERLMNKTVFMTEKFTKSLQLAL